MAGRIIQPPQIVRGFSGTVEQLVHRNLRISRRRDCMAWMKFVVRKGCGELPSYLIREAVGDGRALETGSWSCDGRKSREECQSALE